MKLPTLSRSNGKQKPSPSADRRKEKRQQRKNEILYAEELIPFRDFDEDSGVFIMDDGTICDCLEVVSKDLVSVAEDDLARDILCFDKLYRTYAGDLKLITFTFPSDVRRTREYFEYKIAQTENPAKRKRLEEELSNIKFVGAAYPARTHLILFYGRNPADYQNNLLAIFSVLNRGGSSLVRKIENERKKEYIRMLLNKEPKIFE